MDTLLRRLARSAARRGLAGEHWAWLVMALAAYLLRRGRRSPEAVVASTRLSVGESVVVTLDGPPANR